ncbi:MAG: sigma-70 family RNA polymerase sigma factor [Thermoanaerobaculia bacterium]
MTNFPHTGFPPTRGSMIDAVRSAEASERERGLASLAEAYWQPVYRYVRLRFGRSHEEAADLTQTFFFEVVEKGLLARFDPRRGRLRTFIRVAVDGVVSDDWTASRRQKRGGGAVHLSLEEPLTGFLPVTSPDAPDELFEREWARSMLERALEQLRATCEASGAILDFQLLTCYDLEDQEPGQSRPTYAELARRFDVSETTVTNRLAAARRGLRKAALALLRGTSAGENELRRDERTLFGGRR